MIVGGTTLTSRRAGARGAGFILVAVLIVVMLASMVVVSLMFRMRAEQSATAAGAGMEQAWAAAMSGVHQAMRLASSAAPGALDWQDSPTTLREQLVVDDGVDRWYFTVFGQGDGEREEVRFGLTDESSKLNINLATEEMLEKLPKMTSYLAQGLLDFLDEDNTPRPEGAEQEYYDALPVPYGVFNGPLSTVDELLLVRGFTPALLYGEDANGNYLLDPNEDDGDASFPPDNKDGKLDCGLRQYLTVSSYELNQDNSGMPRIDLNGTNELEVATNRISGDDIPPALVTYIEALRRNQTNLDQPADLLEAKGKFKDENGQEVELDSGVGKTELPLLLDRFTTGSERRLPGLVNINTASAQVLQTLPGIDEALADSIVAARKNLRPEQRRTPAWLYQEALLDAAQFKKVAPLLTARASQFQFHVLGYAVPSGRYRVLDVIIDAAISPPSILYLRDISRLGLPFRIETTDPTDSSGTKQSSPEAGLPSPRTGKRSAEVDPPTPLVRHG